MEEVAIKGQEGMKHLAELAKQGAIMGHLGNLYVERYLKHAECLSKQDSNGSWSVMVDLDISIKCFEWAPMFSWHFMICLSLHMV